VFKEVHRSRSYDQGTPLPLSYKHVKDYCDFFSVYGSYLREVYYDFCMMMDDLWLEIYEEKRKQREEREKIASKRGAKGR
jgi:hypothetical protein